MCKNKEGKYESRLTKCEICAGKGQFHNTYLDDVKRAKSQQEYNKKSDEEMIKNADEEYENIREINDDVNIGKRVAYLRDNDGEYNTLNRIAIDKQPVFIKSFPSKEQIKNDLIGRKVKGWNFDKLEEFKSIRIVSVTLVDTETICISLVVDLIGYRTKKPYHGFLKTLYFFSKNEWKPTYDKDEIIREGEVIKSY